MADYSSLISSIEATIRENGNNEITGPILQTVLKSMISAINSTKADTVSIPTRLAQLQDDVNHRLVTDTQISTWNGKTLALWDDHTIAHEGQPAVDNTVALGLTNSGITTQYTLALATHTHEASTIRGLSTLLEGFVSTDDLAFSSGQDSQSQVYVNSYYGLQVYNETKYFALRNHSHNLQDLLNVTITNPAQGQVLKYNGTGWVNGADSGVSHLYELTGDVTMTSQSYANGQIPIMYENHWRNTGQNIGNFGRPVYIKDNVLTPIGYLSIHPEAGEIIVPFLFNDIAFLQSRGGDCTIQGVTNNPNRTALFNGKSDYCMLEVNATSTVVSITIEMPTDAVYNYTNYFYIDFGNPIWAAQTIAAYFYDASDNIIRDATRTVSGMTGSFWRPDVIDVGGTAIKKIVVECYDFHLTTPRISEIGLVKFNSEGIAQSFMSRGSNDDVWRSIVPATTNYYNLGAEGKRWAAIYTAALNTTGIETTTLSGNPNLSIYGSNGTELIAQYLATDSANFTFSKNLIGTGLDLGAADKRWRDVYANNGKFSVNLYANNGALYLYNRLALQDNQNGTFLINYGGWSVNNIQYCGRSHNFVTSTDGSWNNVLAINPDNIKITKPIQPDWDGATSLGIYNRTFTKLYAQKWYITSSQTDDPTAPHIEWDAVNNSFKVVGNLYATGFITALKTGSGTVSLSIYNDMVAMRSGLVIGSTAIPFERLYVNYLGSAGTRVAYGYFSRVSVESDITASQYFGGEIEWGNDDYSFEDLLDGQNHYSCSLTDYGITTAQLAQFVNGSKNKITFFENTDRICFVNEAKVENGLYTIYFGKNFMLRQTSAYLFDLLPY